MAENDFTGAATVAVAPKKLKLTLKLTSSSFVSSMTSTPLESSTPTNSQINSSISVSPVKSPMQSRPSPESLPAPVHILPVQSGFSELPTGLGNLKGRGRPKKAYESVKPASEQVISNNSIPTYININSGPTSSASASASAYSNSKTALTIESEKSEYSVDLKSLVTSMKTFQSRKWTLKRPLFLEVKTLADFEMKLPAGMWSTNTSELGSSHLLIRPIVSNNAPTNSVVDNLIFEAICQCGKLFNDRSKYRKHVKIHEKSVKNLTEESTAINVVDDDDENDGGITSNPTPMPISITSAAPTISLKLKLNTAANQSH